MKKYFYHSLALCFFFCLFSKLSASNDKVLWGITCPKNVTVDCNAELWDLSIFGNAKFHDHNGERIITNPQVSKNMNMCGSGTITRTFTVEDSYWRMHSCAQVITIGYGSSFNPSHITWPANIELEGCNPNTSPDVTGRPSWLSDDCSLIGTNFMDQVFTVSPDCKKILRMWTLKNWCGSYYSNNTYTYVQTIKIAVNTPPVVKCPEDIVAHSTDCNFGQVVAPPFAVDSSKCGGKYTITNNSPYATSRGADLSGRYPIGTTKVTYTIAYGCGQKQTCSVNVIVKNHNAPSPICLAKIVVALMGRDTDNDGENDEGMVAIWAKDVDVKSYTTCYSSPLSFTFDKEAKMMSKTYTCKEVGINKEKIYVTDKFGGQSACEVEIDVQNNSAKIKDCKPAPDTTKSIVSASGVVSNIYGQKLNNVEVELVAPELKFQYITKFDTLNEYKIVDSFINWSGSKLYITDNVRTITSKTDTIINPEYKMTVATKENGDYNFGSLLKRNNNYMITCPKVETVASSIDSADLLALIDHLSGNKSFVHDYQFLAADVDKSGLIDSMDLVLLSGFLKGDLPSFTDNDVTTIAYKEKMPKLKENILAKNATWHQINNVKHDFEQLNFLMVQLGDISAEKYVTDTINANVFVSENRSKTNNGFSVISYPNPFFNNVNFELQGEEGEVTIEIHSVSGSKQDVQKFNLVKGINKISYDASHLSNGVYVYKVSQGNNNLSGKIIKGL